MIGIGQLCLILGIVGPRLIHPPTDFWTGFVNGLCGVMIGLSLVLNVRGAYLVGKHQRKAS
jgi:hypothetical protein